MYWLWDIQEAFRIWDLIGGCPPRYHETTVFIVCVSSGNHDMIVYWCSADHHVNGQTRVSCSIPSFSLVLASLLRGSSIVRVRAVLLIHPENFQNVLVPCAIVAS